MARRSRIPRLLPALLALLAGPFPVSPAGAGEIHPPPVIGAPADLAGRGPVVTVLPLVWAEDPPWAAVHVEGMLPDPCHLPVARTELDRGARRARVRIEAVPAAPEPCPREATPYALLLPLTFLEGDAPWTVEVDGWTVRIPPPRGRRPVEPRAVLGAGLLGPFLRLEGSRPTPCHVPWLRREVVEENRTVRITVALVAPTEPCVQRLAPFRLLLPAGLGALPGWRVEVNGRPVDP